MIRAVIELITPMSARGAGVLGGVLLSFVVARYAGAEGLGQFAVFLSLLGALAILARHGMDTLLIRAVSWAEVSTVPGTQVAQLLHGVIRVLLPATLLGGAGSCLLASGWLGAPFPGTIVLMPFMVPLLSVLALVSGYAKGRSRAWLAPLFEIGGISMLTVLFIIALALITPAIDGLEISGGFVTALVVLVLVAGSMIWHDSSYAVEFQELDEQQKEELSKGQMDFTLIALAYFLTQAGVFVLAAPFLSEVELGLLRAAERLAFLVSFSLLVIDPIISPRIVRLSRSGDASGLRRLMQRSMLASMVISACVLLPLLVWPERVLELMGSEFAEAAGYLRIMALIQFAVAVLGPLAVLLNMTGRERVSMWINLGTLALALCLIPLLSVTYGSYGFVIAYSAVIVTRLGLVGASALFGRISRAPNDIG